MSENIEEIIEMPTGSVPIYKGPVLDVDEKKEIHELLSQRIRIEEVKLYKRIYSRIQEQVGNFANAPEAWGKEIARIEKEETRKMLDKMKNILFPESPKTAQPEMESTQIDPAKTGEGMQELKTMLSEPKKAEAEQTTNFVDDAVKSIRTIKMERGLPALFAKSSDQFNSQDIKTFVGKPRVLYNGIFQHSDSRSTFTQMYNPTVLTNDTQFAAKLAGYLGFRATLCLRLVVNANPFQRGLYNVVYVPCGGALMNNKWNALYNLYTNTLMERTQVRIMELDLACDTTCEARIPFDSVMNYFPLRNSSPSANVGSWGSFQIVPYISLDSTTGGNSAAFTLYGWFEDVELIGAAAAQMESSISEVEAKKAGQGPVSSILMSFSRASKEVSEVPVMSSFAKDLSWALEIAGRTAKAAGFSKPANVGPTNRVSVSTAMYAGNVEGFDQSLMTAGSSQNEVAVLPGIGGTDIDEMDIGYIAAKPAWYSTTPWQDVATHGVGTQLMAVAVNPMTFIQTRTVGAYTVTSTTPLAFMAGLFCKWRGSIVFDFKLVKTIFHSGRLAISFFPNDPIGATPIAVSYSRTDFVHREIIDIRKCNRFKVTVPYVCSQPFSEMSQSIGYLTVHVVDPLIAPSSVTSNIDLLLEVAGGPDIEFAIPINYNDGTSKGPVGCAFIGATPQMESADEPCGMVDETIGASNINFAGTTNAEYCIGEKITSLRALLKVSRIQLFSTLQTSARMESMYPYGINVSYWDATPTYKAAYAFGDLFDILGACFLYNRGSVRIRKPVLDASKSIIYYCVSTYSRSSPTTFMNRGSSGVFSNVFSPTLFSGGKYVIANGSSMNGCIEFAVPHYNGRHSRVNSADVMNQQTNYNAYDVANLGSGVCVNVTASLALDWNTDYISFSTPFMRAVGDDFTFSRFISTVPSRFVTDSNFYL